MGTVYSSVNEASAPSVSAPNGPRPGWSGGPREGRWASLVIQTQTAQRELMGREGAVDGVL